MAHKNINTNFNFLHSDKLFTAVMMVGVSWPVLAVTQSNTGPKLPEEYLSTGEHATAFANGGSLSSTGYSAVRANPAMLANEKQYTLGGGYHWPVAGREYYQAGIVDSKTSKMAAGVNYSSALDDYEGPWNKDGSVRAGESPVRRRIGIGLAQNLKNFSLGAAGQFVEAADPAKSFDDGANRIKGFTFGVGMIAGITTNVRFGLSVENLANKKVAFAAPTIYRGGLAWGAAKDVMLYLDYRRREAVETFEAPPPALSIVDLESDTSTGSLSSEQSLLGGASVKVFDLLRLSAGAGGSSSGGQATSTVAGGLALVNKSFSFAYAVQRPDLKFAGVHHSVSLGLDMAL